jgi:penicillin-binding protein 1A
MVGALAWFVNGVTRDLPNIGDVKSVVKNQTSYIYAADGTQITKLYHENRTIVPLAQISPNLQKAVIAVEDQRFYEHSGIDLIRIVGALVRDIRTGGASQGGSTITQQYVKNAYFSPEKTIVRKVREAFLAMELERNYTKAQILEKYLNTIYFGNRSYGIEAASESYFGVPASKLTIEQSALLAGLIKGPELYNPYKDPVGAMQRRNLVIDLMAQQGSVKKPEAETMKKHPIVLASTKQRYNGIAPYYAEWIKTELKKLGFDEKDVYSQGLKIYTTLDTKLQEYADTSWKKYLPSPRDPDVALVAIDPKTGAVKAMVGGKNFNKSKFNNAAQGLRQPGSSFKPITLAAGLMNGVSPDDGFQASSPLTIHVPGTKPWVVHNYSGESGSGFVSLRRATAMSINVVYAGLIMKVGVEKTIEAARKLGITSPINPNPSITLGGLRPGLTPLEMASAYSTFANNGAHNPAFGVQKIIMPNGQVIYDHKVQPKPGVDQAVAALVNDILKGVVQSGTGARARIGRPVAGKTGTTQDYRDAWFVGYTPDLVASVWVGYQAKEDPMRNVHGIKVAGGTFPAQIWAAFMKKALKGVPEHDFPDAPPGSLTYVSLCDESNGIANEFCPKVSKHVFVRKYRPRSLKTCTLHKAIQVPNLVGMTQADAIAALTAAKLGSAIFTKIDATVPLAQVIEQNPAAETAVKEGAIISITVSGTTNKLPAQTPDTGNGDGNTAQVSVPNVVGMTADQATNNLQNEGFLVSQESQVSDVPVGQVINQDPSGGYQAQKGATVKIIVSGTSTSSTISNTTVPNVIGRSEAAARNMLESRGFIVVIYNDTKRQSIRRYGMGMVSNQNPAARTDAAPGSKVIIYVTTQG